MSDSQAQFFEDELPLIRSCRALNELRLAEELTDLTIEVKHGGRLHVHRLMLAARIPALGDLGPLRSNTTVLRWPTVPQSIATAVIQYAYTGQLEITQANVMGVVGLARMVQLPVLEHWGKKFLANNLSTENLEKALLLAKSLDSRSLMDACIRQMAGHFESYVYSDIFVRLPSDFVVSVLRSEALVVASEEDIFCAISRWASTCNEFGEKKMKEALPMMLKEIQWDQTSAQFRGRLLDYHPIFRNSTECSRLMARVENWIVTSKNSQTPCPFNLHSRRPQSFFVFGKDSNAERWSVLRLDPQLENEERIADMEERYFATYSVVEASIFAVGGSSAQQQGITSVQEFIVRERRWRTRAPLACRRQEHAAVVVRVAAADGREGGEKSLIAIVGGCFQEGDTWTQLASCELYDVNQNRWHTLPDLPQTRDGPAAACLPGDRRVFVFGGHFEPSYHDSVVFCHLKTDWEKKVNTASTGEFWLPAAPMRNARAYLAAVPFRGRIVVTGGRNSGGDLRAVEVFSPPNADCPLGQWTEVAGMTQPRSCFYQLTSGDAVFALGNFYEPRKTIEAFTAPRGSADMGNDFKSWIWSTKTPIKTLALIEGAANVRI